MRTAGKDRREQVPKFLDALEDRDDRVVSGIERFLEFVPLLRRARGNMENRIKERQLNMFPDRTSAATMRANQLRLYLSSAAYILIHALRRLGLQGYGPGSRSMPDDSTELLKIGAQVRVTVRNIWISLAGRYPYAETFAAIVRNLQVLPLRC